MFNYFVDYCLTKLYCAFYLYIYIYIPKHNRKFPETEAKINTFNTYTCLLLTAQDL